MSNAELKKGITIKELEAKIREVNPNPNVENVLKIFNELHTQYESDQYIACS